MKFPFGRPLPVERPLGPFRGYKLAYPMLAGDGHAAGFKGIWSSALPVYQVRDTAACFWNNRHAPPERRCGCGFYCLHSSDAASSMACEGRYRSTVILEVEGSGRFIRYEEGFRYSDQLVRAVHLNRCLCGRSASVLVDSGTGVTGWLQLQPSCLACSIAKQTITPSKFGDLLGVPDLVVTDATPPEGERPDWVPNDPTAVSTLSVLAAEVALLQARVDSLQEQISRSSEQGEQSE